MHGGWQDASENANVWSWTFTSWGDEGAWGSSVWTSHDVSHGWCSGSVNAGVVWSDGGGYGQPPFFDASMTLSSVPQVGYVAHQHHGGELHVDISQQLLTYSKDQLFSLDVECVATGMSHELSDRSPCSLALVDADSEVLLKLLIKPDKPIVSHLSALTGIQAGDLDGGCPLSDAIVELKRCLPTNAVLVGQAPAGDIAWMHLEQGTDFLEVIDIAELLKGYSKTYCNYNYHCLQHEADVLLNKPASGAHDPVWDAQVSMELYNKIVRATPEELEGMRRQLLYRRPAPSVAKQFNYQMDGVCLAKYMTHKCICGRSNR